MLILNNSYFVLKEYYVLDSVLRPLHKWTHLILRWSYKICIIIRLIKKETETQRLSNFPKSEGGSVHIKINCKTQILSNIHAVYLRFSRPQ